MVWTKFKKDIFKRNIPVKKFKDGVPKPEYFMHGLASINKITNLKEKNWKFVEVYPVQNKEADIIPSIMINRPRSIELWKSPDVQRVRIILGGYADDIDHFVKEMDVGAYEYVKETEPKNRPKRTARFNVELAGQKNFTTINAGSKDIITETARMLAGAEWGWVQILFSIDERLPKILHKHLDELQCAIKEQAKSKSAVHIEIGRNLVPRVGEQKIPHEGMDVPYLKRIERDYSRLHGRICAVSVLWAISETADYLHLADSVISGNLHAGNDEPRMHGYEDYPMFDQIMQSRTLLDENSLALLAKNSKLWKDGFKLGKSVDYCPFLCMNADEFVETLGHMPYGDGAPVKFSPKYAPATVAERTGLCIGHASAESISEIKYGSLVEATPNTTVYDLHDITRHTYILGTTGSGKSTMVRNLLKHIEMASRSGFEASWIYVDSKDHDGRLILHQLEHDANVTYLDFNEGDLGINLLELPEYEKDKRDVTVSLMVGHVLEMFKEFYSQSQVYVQMERLIKLILHLLYHNRDDPTMAEMYRIITLIKEKGGIGAIESSYRIPGEDFRRALKTALTLREDAWTPVFNRIETFMTDPYVRHHFGVQKSTVDFAEMIKPGSAVIIRISDTETPGDVHRMALMTIVMQVWNAVKMRASRTEPDARTPILLALDEFQRIGRMDLFGTLLSQARSFGMGLCLSHQNTDQIGSHLLESIFANCATQIFGRLSGSDAARVSRLIDPDGISDLKGKLASLPDYAFLVKQKSPDGQSPPQPSYCNSIPPPPAISEGKENEIMGEMIKRYGIKPEEETTRHGGTFEGIHAWKNLIMSPALYENEVGPVNYLTVNEAATITTIAQKTGIINRQHTKNALVSLIGGEYVKTAPNPKIKGSLLYSLTEKGRKSYADFDYSKIGSSKETAPMARIAEAYYRSCGWFVCIARQDMRNGDYCPDMVAYDHTRAMPVSVEIESYTEVKSHPEHVQHNMTKWPGIGCKMCDVWTTFESAIKIRNNLTKLGDRVRVFLVNLDTMTATLDGKVVFGGNKSTANI